MLPLIVTVAPKSYTLNRQITTGIPNMSLFLTAGITKVESWRSLLCQFYVYIPANDTVKVVIRLG